MFKLAQQPIVFRHEVTIHVPANGGYDSSQSLNCEFVALSGAEQDKFDAASAAGTDAYLDAILKSFDGVIGDDGRPVPYTAELRRRLLDLPYVRHSIIRGYLQALALAKLGN